MIKFYDFRGSFFSRNSSEPTSGFLADSQRSRFSRYAGSYDTDVASRKLITSKSCLHHTLWTKSVFAYCAFSEQEETRSLHWTHILPFHPMTNPIMYTQKYMHAMNSALTSATPPLRKLHFYSVHSLLPLRLSHTSSFYVWPPSLHICNPLSLCLEEKGKEFVVKINPDGTSLRFEWEDQSRLPTLLIIEVELFMLLIKVSFFVLVIVVIRKSSSRGTRWLTATYLKCFRKFARAF